MKGKTLLLLSGLALVASCKENNQVKDKKTQWLPDVTKEDHGSLQQKEVIGDFDEIEVSQSIKAEIIKADVEKIVISAPSNILNEILVEQSGGKVHIHYKSGVRVINAVDVTAKIYARDFSKVKANSSASIAIKDKFVQDKTDIEVSSSGAVTGNLEANNLDISTDSSGSFDGEIWAINLDAEAESAGSIIIKGKSKNATINTSSGGSISAKQMMVENVKADASSGANVEISVSHSVDAEASSGGSVSVFKTGNLSVVRKEESSGGSATIQ
ncbi:head GIN domain-containing protein [Chryseobacterium sp.]|uniref:head GIN domain-containing protein n=1 Tax=Chryseobacterium sp. TaxID=1871047 RepID=UPI0038910790